jgi:hypothetical protein
VLTSWTGNNTHLLPMSHKKCIERDCHGLINPSNNLQNVSNNLSWPRVKKKIFCLPQDTISAQRVCH